MHLRHWLAHSALAVIQITTAFADGFEVSGSTETFGKTYTNRHTFLVQTDGTNVFIHCTAGTRDKGVKGSEFGSDGTNGFHLVRFLHRVEPGKNSGLVNDAVMHIEPSPIPPRRAGAISDVWLVYASAPPLRRNTNGYLPPRGVILPREVEGDRERWGMLSEHLLFRAEWAFDASPPKVLQRYVEFRDVKFDTDRYSPSLIPAAMKTGRTNFHFEVLAWTNVAGMHLPTDAQITSYRVNTNNPAGPLQVHLVTRLRTTHVARALPRRSFIPEPTRATHVFDYRFAESPQKPAAYLSTEGVIYHTAEEAWAAVQRQNDEAVREHREREKAK